MSVQKTCTKCLVSKGIEHFRKNKLGKYGVTSWCTPCFRAHQRADRAKNQERDNARSRAWSAKNKELRAARARAAWAKDPEAHKEYLRLRRKRTPEKMREYAARKRAKRLAALRAADVSFTASEWRSKMEAHGYRCAYCGKRSRLQMDHVVPLSRGGKHVTSNIVPSCGPCNNSKGARDVNAWLAMRGGASHV